MLKDYQDITSTVGPLNTRTEKVEWPMYSYHRPAEYFWQGMYEGMKEQGLSDATVRDILQSKLMRWEFDGELSEVVFELGRQHALKHALGWRRDIKKI